MIRNTIIHARMTYHFHSILCCMVIQAYTVYAQSINELENKPDISYTIHLNTINNNISLNIHCYFDSDTSNYTDICFFPQPNWNQHQYLVKAIHSDTPSVHIEQFPNSLFWRVYHPPNSRVHIRYDITHDSTAFNQENMHQPLPVIFNDNYFLIENASMLTIPVSWLEDEANILKQRKIRIDWRTDSSWQYANSFGMNIKTQIISVSARDLLRSMTIGSRNQKKCTISTFTISTRQSLQIAISGAFIPQYELFANTIKHIVQSSILFWQDTTRFNYIATVIPVEMAQEDVENGVIGFSIANAFVAMMSEKRNNMNFSCKYLFAHEMLHKWINGECFPLQDFSGFGYCAAEGFTDYVARYILLQNGSITKAEYLRDMNIQIESYLQSPFKNIIADSVKKNFWNSLQIMRVPYRRGDILAHIWASEIRKHTKGKHDFATALRDIMQQHSGTAIIDQIFAKSLEPYIGRNVIDDILKYMKNGETIPIPSDMIPFARVIKAQGSADIPQFELLPESK